MMMFTDGERKKRGDPMKVKLGSNCHELRPPALIFVPGAIRLAPDWKAAPVG